MTRREWRYARQKGVIVYPVKGASDSELDYASLPTWMHKAHFFDLSKEWQTFTNYLKSDRQPIRVPFMAPDLPRGFVQRQWRRLLHLPIRPNCARSMLVTPRPVPRKTATISCVRSTRRVAGDAYPSRLRHRHALIDGSRVERPSRAEQPVGSLRPPAAPFLSGHTVVDHRYRLPAKPTQQTCSLRLGLHR
jgi:hypothetical protein